MHPCEECLIFKTADGRNHVYCYEGASSSLPIRQIRGQKVCTITLSRDNDRHIDVLYQKHPWKCTETVGVVYERLHAKAWI